MDETVLKIAIAGFMHDIGKFAQEGITVSDEFLNGNAGLYQPFYNGHHTHKHAVYTAAFVDHIEKLLPAVFNKANWGLDDTFINLAAGHHNPQTPLQWIIAMADRISSGWDRSKFDQYNQSIAWQNYRKTRLLPILERLSPKKDAFPAGESQYCYALKELSPTGIFPGRISQTAPSDNEKAQHEYKVLFESFVDALENLLHREENIELWFEHFDSLMMIYTSTIPTARAGNVVPDVSLYDHSRITAALAVALYLFHLDTDSMTIDAIRDYNIEKFLLISGDLFGIQKFIFSESGEAMRYRSKILRGRSFAVSLLSELAADMLCRQIGLPASSVVLNAAGKFTLIAPNTKHVKSIISEVENEINTWMMKISYGETSLGIISQAASPDDFVAGNFADLWERLGKKTEEKKYQKFSLDRFGGVVDGYLESFRNELQRPLCPFCGKRPSSLAAEGTRFSGEIVSACNICRDHIFLGENIVKNKRIAITTLDADIKGEDNKLLEPIYGRYQVAFLKGALKEMASNRQLMKYWDISINPDGIIARDITARFIGGYVTTYREDDLNDNRLLEGSKSPEKKLELIEQHRDGMPKTFAHIACKSMNTTLDNAFEGIEALGTLKADVDQLGLLMSCGLNDSSFTISRLASLSRQLNEFFTVYLPHFLMTDERFRDVYTVFAGGDDLFLIGPWNTIIDLAAALRDRFAEYVCHNAEIHFSAGICLHKAHTPLNKLADSSEAALGRSKNLGRDRITLFSETVTWDEFMKLQNIKKTMQDWREKSLMGNAMMYRLNDFISMAGQEKQLIEAQREIFLEDMDCLKWRSLFSYTTERNIGKNVKSSQREDMQREFSQTAFWLQEYGSAFRIALWDVIYNQR